MKHCCFQKCFVALLAIACLTCNLSLADADGSLSEIISPYLPAIGMAADAAIEVLHLEPDACIQDSENDLLLAARQTISATPFTQTLLIDRRQDTVYGMRFTSSRTADPTAARSLAVALTDMLTSEYGQPDTYPTEYLAPSTLDEDAAAALSIYEYWYFALPQHLCCEVRVHGADDEYKEYFVTLTYALSMSPGVDYALGGEAAPYMALIGQPRTDVCSALNADLNAASNPGEYMSGEAELLGYAAQRALLFDVADDTLYGVRYRFDAADAQSAAELAARLYRQAAQEYGPDDTYPLLSNRLMPADLVGDMINAPCCRRADWQLHTADASLPGLALELLAESNTDGAACVTLSFALVHMPG